MYPPLYRSIDKLNAWNAPDNMSGFEIAWDRSFRRVAASSEYSNQKKPFSFLKYLNDKCICDCTKTLYYLCLSVNKCVCVCVLQFLFVILLVYYNKKNVIEMHCICLAICVYIILTCVFYSKIFPKKIVSHNRIIAEMQRNMGRLFSNSILFGFGGFLILAE